MLLPRRVKHRKVMRGRMSGAGDKARSSSLVFRRRDHYSGRSRPPGAHDPLGQARSILVCVSVDQEAC